jgi:CRP/FNR family cyclic AMP-dependent transcriptional regulator
MGANLDTLAQVPLFSGLGRRELNRIADAMTERTFPAGVVVTREGEPGVGFFVIEEGRATVRMHGDEVGQLSGGDHFGEIALIAETPRAATITAETDLHCYGMTSWDFRKIVERNGEIAWSLLASTARKLYENAERERARTA